MGYEVLKETPLSVEKMSNLDGIIWAVAPEYENASLFLGGLENLNNFDPRVAGFGEGMFAQSIN